MKTQTLIFAIFFLLIIGILTAALVGMWQGQIQISGYQKYAIEAFYLACAGTERAKVEVLNDVSLSGWHGWYTDLDNPHDNFTFRYGFSVNINGNQREITGVGEVLDASSNILAHREITLIVEGVVDSDHDGVDDDFSATIKPWSWREI